VCSRPRLGPVSLYRYPRPLLLQDPRLPLPLRRLTTLMPRLRSPSRAVTSSHSFGQWRSAKVPTYPVRRLRRLTSSARVASTSLTSLVRASASRWAPRHSSVSPLRRLISCLSLSSMPARKPRTGNPGGSAPAVFPSSWIRFVLSLRLSCLTRLHGFSRTSFSHTNSPLYAHFTPHVVLLISL
jgi:hypothetical protein